MGYFDFTQPVNKNITLIARYKIKTFDIIIQQDEHSTVTVEYDGVEYTTSFIAEWGKEILVKSCVYDEIYGRESLTVNGTEVDIGYKVTVDKEFNVTTISRLEHFTFTIPALANQTVTLECNGVVHTSSTTEVSFETIYGQVWNIVSVLPSDGYCVGTITEIDGIITDNYTLQITPATVKTYTITVTQPENGNIAINGTVGTTFAFNYGTSINTLATANAGYYVACLDVSDGPATMYNLVIPATTNQTINVLINGTDTYSSTNTEQTISLEYGKAFIARVVPNEGYNAGTLNLTNGAISNNVTLTITDAIPIE